jgi:hypothetical protein
MGTFSFENRCPHNNSYYITSFAACQALFRIFFEIFEKSLDYTQFRRFFVLESDGKGKCSALAAEQKQT